MATTNGRHKRVLRDGQTSRGPARWARAAGNAFENPNSKGGRLYLRRSSIAYKMMVDYPDTEGTFAHIKCDWTYNFTLGKRMYLLTDEVNYYTCSQYCAAMVVQLDHMFENYEQVEAFFMEDSSVRLQAPTRTVRCYCCGSDIKP